MVSKATATNQTYLVCDSREFDVNVQIKEKIEKERYVVKQVTHGDFIFCKSGKGAKPAEILACVERKRWKDFAAGFKDGRYANLNNLLELRNTTGCMIIFVIEGIAFPEPSRKVCRVPYNNILSALRLMVIRHGIPYFQTKDQEHTAVLLKNLLNAYDENSGAVYSYPARRDNMPSEEEKGVTIDSDKILPSILTKRTVETDKEITAKMWSSLKGVSIVLGTILTSKFSLSQLIGGHIPASSIKLLKTAGGRAINKHANRNLTSLVKGASTEIGIKVLSGIKGIGKETASAILNSAKTLKRVCSYSPKTLGLIKMNSGNKLGEKKAARILQIMTYVDNTTAKNEKQAAKPVAKQVAKQVTKPAKSAPIRNFVMSETDADDFLSICHT